jgi:integrase
MKLLEIYRDRSYFHRRGSGVVPERIAYRRTERGDMAVDQETERTHLTKRSVDALRPDPAGDYFIWDDELAGFGCRVYPTGKKVYVLKYRLGGRAGQQRRRKLGAHGVVTPEEARRQAKALLGIVAQRADPHAEADRARTVTRVSEAVENYLKHADVKLKPKTATEYRRLFKRHILPAIGKMALADVTPTIVGRMHEKLSKSPVQANRVLTRLSSFFTWCRDRGLVDRLAPNPCASITHYVEDRQPRYLEAAEALRLGAALIKAATEGLPQPARRSRPVATGATAKHRAKTTAGVPVPANPLAVGAIRFALLTGMRRGEVLNLRWSEVDSQRAQLRLSDSKTGAKVVQIGAPALLLLSSLPRAENATYVFASADGKRPLESVRRVWDAVRVAAKIEDVRFHDLRHSFASYAAGKGESLLMIASLLGHKDVSTTQRYAHLVDDRRKAAADATAGHVANVLGLPTHVREESAKLLPFPATA